MIKKKRQTQPCNIYYIYHNKAVLDQIFMYMITEKSSNIDKIVDNAGNSIDLVEMKKKAVVIICCNVWKITSKLCRKSEKPQKR